MPESSSIESWNAWERHFRSFLEKQMRDSDAAHDRAHVERVVETARRLAQEEGAEPAVVRPAAWLHDCVALPKDHPERDEASTRAAEAAHTFLHEVGYPTEWIDPITHAIAAHSYSGDVSPRTTEAKVLQDADRLDALGAIGLARCFMVGAELGHSLYDPDDPFCKNRPPDDDTYAIDHFYTKLLTLPDTMQTDAGRQEAERRAEFLHAYLEQLADELGLDAPPRHRRTLAGRKTPSPRNLHGAGSSTNKQRDIEA